MTTAIHWFRQDLRLADNPALLASAEADELLCVYIHDPDSGHYPGAAAGWWLHHALDSLGRDLAALGQKLILLSGNSEDLLTRLVTDTGTEELSFTRCYEPGARKLEEQVYQKFRGTLTVRRYGGSILFEPESIASQAGTPFRVFTPFWRACAKSIVEGNPIPSPRPAPSQLPPPTAFDGESLAAWSLLPTQPDWATGFGDWQPGADGAQTALERFLDHNGLDGYADNRNRPDTDLTSRLSPHLHIGSISPRQVWHQAAKRSTLPADKLPMDPFLRELGWRDFCYHLLFHWPEITEREFRPAFREFPWVDDPDRLTQWQQGRTGYPLVDAGMRQLWQTGWMHNRVRMVVASYLCKDLLIDWRHGAAWFEDTLVDADVASNRASWQWVAGCGADAAPYFRIFNPTSQAKRFDPEGDYIRRWVPELARLPKKFIHEPWEAPALVLAEAGVELGKAYPDRQIDHAVARDRALAAFDQIKAA